MKLNQRDKLILIVVLVVLIWVAGVSFFIKPAIDKVNTASTTLNSKEMELEALEQQLADEANLRDDVDAAYKEATDNAGDFYSLMVQHDVLTEVQSQLDVNADTDDQDIKNLDLNISALSSAALNRYIYEPASVDTPLGNIVSGLEADAVDLESLTTPTELNAYSINFQFESTKKDLLKFIENLQTNTHRSLVVRELSIYDMFENEDDTVINGEMTLDFYMVPTLKSPDDVEKMEYVAVNTEE